MNTNHDEVLRALRSYGLAFPEAHLKSPWPDHLDLAVNDKTFTYLPAEILPGQGFRVSCKLPRSALEALAHPFTRPAGYGLHRSGWVEAFFGPQDPVPVPLLQAWIEESYRAQALKRQVRLLDASSPRP